MYRGCYYLLAFLLGEIGWLEKVDDGEGGFFCSWSIFLGQLICLNLKGAVEY